MWRFKFLSSFDSKMTPLGKSYRLPCLFEKLKLPYFKRPVLPDSQKVKCLMWFYLPPPFFRNLWSAGSQDVQWKMWFFPYIDIKSNVGMIFLACLKFNCRGVPEPFPPFLTHYTGIHNKLCVLYL